MDSLVKEMFHFLGNVFSYLLTRLPATIYMRRARPSTIAQCPLIERGFTGGQLERDGRKEGRREQRILEIAKVLVTIYIY